MELTRTVAQSEYAHSFFLASTLQSTSVPVVSATLPLTPSENEMSADIEDASDDVSAEYPDGTFIDDVDGAMEGGEDLDEVAPPSPLTALGVESMVIGSFTHEGLTFAMVGEKELALIAIEPELLSDQAKETSSLALPGKVIFDDEDVYSLASISSTVFARNEESLVDTLIIPASVSAIADDAFEGATALQNIVVAGNNESYSSYDGCLYDADLTSLLLVPEGRLGTVRIASSTEEVGPAALSHCAGVVALSVDADSAALQALEDDELYNANGDRIEITVADKTVDATTEDDMASGEVAAIEDAVLMLSSNEFLSASKMGTSLLAVVSPSDEGPADMGSNENGLIEGEVSSDGVSIETAQTFAANNNGGLVTKGDIPLYFGNLDESRFVLSPPSSPDAYLNKTSTKTPNYGAEVSLTYNTTLVGSTSYTLKVSGGNTTAAKAIWSAMIARANIAAPSGKSIVGINMRGVGNCPDASTYVSYSQFVSGNFAINFTNDAKGGSYPVKENADGSIWFPLLFGVVYGSTQTITSNDRIELYAATYGDPASTGFASDLPRVGSPDVIMNAIEDATVSNYGAQPMRITWRAYKPEQDITNANQYDLAIQGGDWDKAQAAWNNLAKRFRPEGKTLAGFCPRIDVAGPGVSAVYLQNKDAYISKNDFLKSYFTISFDSSAIGGTYKIIVSSEGALTFRLLVTAVYEQTSIVSAGDIRAYFGNLSPNVSGEPRDDFSNLPHASAPDAYLNATSASSTGAPNYGASVKISWTTASNSPNPFISTQNDKNISYRLEVSGGDTSKAKTIWDAAEARLKRAGQTLCGWVLRGGDRADGTTFISKEAFLSGTFSTSFKSDAWGGAYPGSLSEDGTFSVSLLFGAVYSTTQNPVKGDIELYIGNISEMDKVNGNVFTNMPAPGKPDAYLNATSSKTPNYGGNTNLTWTAVDNAKNPFVGSSGSMYSLQVTNGNKSQAAAIWNAVETRLAQPGRTMVGFVTRKADPIRMCALDRGSYVSKEEFLSGTFKIEFTGAMFGGSYPGSFSEDGTMLCRLIFGAVYAEDLSGDRGTIEMYFGQIDEKENFPIITKPGNPSGYFSTAGMSAPNYNAKTTLTYTAFDGIKNPLKAGSGISYTLKAENGDPAAAKTIWNNVEAALAGEGKQMVGITARGSDGFPDMSTYVSKEQFLSGSFTMKFGGYALGGSFPGYLNEDGSYLFRMLYHAVIEDLPAVSYTFHANDGAWSDGDTEKTFTSYEGAALQVPDASLGLKRSGYTFDKWVDASGAALPGKVPSADADYYAKWTGIKYTLRFDANGDGVADADFGTLTVALDDDPVKDLATPAALTGFVFDGWSFTNKGGKTIDYSTDATAAHVLTDLVEQSPYASDSCLLAARWHAAVRATVPLQVNVGLGVGETLASNAALFTNSTVDLDVVKLTVEAPDASGASLSFAAGSDAAKVFPSGIKGMALVLGKLGSEDEPVQIEVGNSVTDATRVGGLFIPAAQSGKDGELDLSYDIRLNGVSYDFMALRELERTDGYKLPLMKLCYTVAPAVTIWEQADTTIISETM